MTQETEKIVKILKGLIDKNGPDYLTNKPMNVYSELKKSKSADNKTAAALLCFFVSDIARNISTLVDDNDLPEKIGQECSFNESMSASISEILQSLYSKGNKQEWDEKNLEGFNQFLKEKLNIKWKGDTFWNPGNGTMDCHYEANIVLQPTKQAKNNKGIKELIASNPLATKEAFIKLVTEQIVGYLDEEFEDYCSCDDYYPPVCEDFEAESYLEDWCKINGFNIVSFDGDGFLGDFEPKFRRYY